MGTYISEAQATDEELKMFLQANTLEEHLKRLWLFIYHDGSWRHASVLCVCVCVGWGWGLDFDKLGTFCHV